VSILLGVGVNLGSIIKWTIRIALILFFVIGFLLLSQGVDIFKALRTDHQTTTLALTFLTCISFLGFIIPKRKKREINGGETVMKKYTLVILGVVSVLVTLIVSLVAFNKETISFITHYGGGFGQWLMGLGGGFNAWLGGFAPYQVAIGSGIAGIAFAYVMAYVLIPRAKDRLHKTAAPAPTYQGAPSYAPGKQIQSTPIKAKPEIPVEKVAPKEEPANV